MKNYNKVFLIFGICIFSWSNIIAKNTQKRELVKESQEIINSFQRINLKLFKPWNKASMSLISKYNSRGHFAHIAAAQGNIAALKAVYKEFGNINQVGEGGMTPLGLAAMANRLDVVKFLIKHGAKIGAFSKGEKFLYNQIILDLISHNIVEYLIKNGLPKSYREKNNKFERTNFIGPIYIRGNYKFLELFFKNNHYEKGSEIDKIYELAVQKNQTIVLRILEKHHIEPSVYALLMMKKLDKVQRTKLIYKLHNKLEFRKNESLFACAIMSNNPERMETLLTYFPEEGNTTYYVRKSSGKSISPLNVAIAQKNNNLKLLKVLLKNGAEVNPNDKIFIHPLIWATKQQNLAAIKILVEAGSDFKQAEGKERSLLGFAIVVNASKNIIEYYINKKVNLNYTFKDLPPIAWAVKKERLEVIKLLLKHGAKREFIDSETKKSISIAEWTKKLNEKSSLKNYSKIIKLLK